MVRAETKLLVPLGIVLIGVAAASIWAATVMTKRSYHVLRDLNKQLLTCKAKSMADEIESFLASGNLLHTKDLIDRTINGTSITAILVLDTEGNGLLHAGDMTEFEYNDLIANGSRIMSSIKGNEVVAVAPVMNFEASIGTVVLRMPLASIFPPLRRWLLGPLLVLLLGFILAILVGRIYLYDISNEMRSVVREAREIAGGNLKHYIPTLASIGSSLMTSISEMVLALQKRLGEINEGAEIADNTTQKIYDKVIKQKEHTSQIGECVTEVSNIAEHFFETVCQVEVDVKQVSDQAEATVQRILALGSKAQQIGTVTTAINDIAKRINLLSLNASIEAVQAGEHGQGFAVVAAEIRKLAESTKRSVEDIGELIEDIQSATNTTILSTEQTVDSVKRITEAVQQQGAAGKQVKVAINEINNGMKQGFEIVGYLVENVEQLRQATLTMRSALTQFEL